jgi:hypothetical protein
VDATDLIKAAGAVISTAVACTWVLRSKLSAIESKLGLFVEKVQNLEARVIKLEDRGTRRGRKR